MGMLASLRLLVASAGWLAAIPGLAVGQERPLTGTVGVSSDYTFRGVSQTLGDPALQASADLDLPAGLYAWAWGSNVDFVPDGEADDHARTEIDLAIGYARDISDSLGIEVELVDPGGVGGQQLGGLLDRELREREPQVLPRVGVRALDVGVVAPPHHVVDADLPADVRLGRP